MKSPKKTINHIVGWLKAYLEDAGMNGFVVGVSGGIDSALTSTLCAMTGKPVLCLEMPIHQDSEQVNRALAHIQWLKSQFSNVAHHSISLSPVFEQFKTQLPPTDLRDEELHSLANTRARLRMSTLYYFAALHRYLVAGTGNKVEDFGVGFYTKYGDGGVDLSPIADLMKSQVYALAAHLNVSESILNAAPTDGLWSDNRTDEDQLGVRYEDLEWAMMATEKRLDPNGFSDTQKKVFEHYNRFHKQNKHKMLPIPVCKIPADII